jgi:hypothetical protein
MEALRYKPFSIGIRPYLETTIRHTGHDSVEELLEANYELSAKYISKIKVRVRVTYGWCRHLMVGRPVVEACS